MIRNVRLLARSLAQMIDVFGSMTLWDNPAVPATLTATFTTKTQRFVSFSHFLKPSSSNVKLTARSTAQMDVVSGNTTLWVSQLVNVNQSPPSTARNKEYAFHVHSHVPMADAYGSMTLWVNSIWKCCLRVNYAMMTLFKDNQLAVVPIKKRFTISQPR